MDATLFSNTMRRKVESVNVATPKALLNEFQVCRTAKLETSEVNEQTGEYALSEYLIAQLAKNFTGGMNRRLS